MIHKHTRSHERRYKSSAGQLSLFLPRFSSDRSHLSTLPPSSSHVHILTTSRYQNSSLPNCKQGYSLGCLLSVVLSLLFLFSRIKVVTPRYCTHYASLLIFIYLEIELLCRDLRYCRSALIKRGQVLKILKLNCIVSSSISSRRSFSPTAAPSTSSSPTQLFLLPRRLVLCDSVFVDQSSFLRIAILGR